jgi:hypothetical protein
MLIRELWQINRPRAGGLFNVIFFWMYLIVLPGCFLWDFFDWIERTLDGKK